MSKRFWAIWTIIIWVSICPASRADSDLATGIKCYQKQDFKDALIHFQKVLKANPKNCNALYYSAIIYHRQGSTKQAMDAYRKIIANCPNTDAATNAAAALAYLDPAYARRISPGQSSAGSVSGVQQGIQQYSTVGNPDLDKLPDESQVFFEPQGNNLLIDAYVNNRPVKMVFDTGAEMVVFGKNHLRELGITVPEGKPTGVAVGVGEGGAQRTWQTRATIKVGQIERTNFPIIVQENMPTMPLLGQTFFKDFHYSIDKGTSGTGSGSIRFKKKSSVASASTASSSSEAVPFVRQGNELVVSVQINGKATPMYFDTGAEQCVFSLAQLQHIGIAIPDDAQAGMSMGIAGATQTRIFNVARMQLGPIVKTDVPISVVENYNMPFPLLGQTFFGDLRYEMDNQAHVIRLRR